jgi:ABC-type lipoprotein release transport system permease subunit
LTIDSQCASLLSKANRYDPLALRRPGATRVPIGIGPIDVASRAGAAAVILLAARVASAVPAHRASRIDPIEALRPE